MTPIANNTQSKTFHEPGPRLSSNALSIDQTILTNVSREDLGSLSLVNKVFRKVVLRFVNGESKIHFIHIKHTHTFNVGFAQTDIQNKIGVTFPIEMIKRAIPNRDKLTELTIRSQLETAKVILEHPHSPVISEALHYDLTMKVFSANRAQEILHAYREIFPKGIPENYEELNEVQKQELYDHGAEIILFYTQKIKKIYKSIHEDKRDLFNKELCSGNFENLDVGREKELMLCAKEAAIKHKDNTVIAVYGAGHELKPHCDKEGFSYEEIDTRGDSDVFHIDTKTLVDRLLNMVCISTDVADGKSIGIITKNSKKAVPFEKTPDGWIGSIPTNMSYKFVTISHNGSFQAEKVNSAYHNANGCRILHPKVCAHMYISKVTFDTK